MPKAVEEKLKREAARKFPHDPERRRRYVYGTLENMKKKQARKRKPR